MSRSALLEVSYFYWNFHHCKWTRRASGRVMERLPAVRLFGVEFIVDQGGRERVISEGRKNPHAFAVAHEFVALESDPGVDGMVEVYYNPLHTEGFREVLTEKPVAFADEAVLRTDRRVFARGVR